MNNIRIFYLKIFIFGSKIFSIFEQIPFQKGAGVQFRKQDVTLGISLVEITNSTKCILFPPHLDLLESILLASSDKTRSLT